MSGVYGMSATMSDLACNTDFYDKFSHVIMSHTPN